MSRVLELRQKKGGTFNDSTSLVYVKTHKSAVVGLLDGSDKIDINILPNSILGASKNAGSIDANITLANALTAIASAMNNETSLYPGSFLISNGSNQINSSAGHTIQYNDENGPSYADSASLEHGDHLYLISSDTNTYKWDEVATRPVGEIKYYDSIASRNEDNITGLGTNVAVTGFTLSPTDEAGYNAAPGRDSVTLHPGDSASFNNIAMAMDAADSQAWDAGNGYTGTALRVSDEGHYYYYILVPNGTSGSIKYYTSVVNNNQYIWGVINNTTPLATNTTAGLMSGADKNKLNNLSNYSHPTDGASVTINGGDITFVSDLTTNSLGHVTSADFATIRSASTTAIGVVQLATIADVQTGDNVTKALTALSGKALVDRFGSLKQYGLITSSDLGTANGNHENEAFALFETTITPAS